MEYRKMPHGTEEVSVIGLGTSSIQAASEKEMEETLIHAAACGVNYFDMGSAAAKPFPVYGRTLAGCRDRVYYQIHFGADYSSGTYGWTTDLDAVKRSVDWQLKALRTDYIDFGMIHCIDEESDLHAVQKNGVIDYILDLKRQGVVRHVGLSSHTPEQVKKVLDMGILDIFNHFTVNHESRLNYKSDRTKGTKMHGVVGDDESSLFSLPREPTSQLAPLVCVGLSRGRKIYTTGFFTNTYFSGIVKPVQKRALPGKEKEMFRIQFVSFFKSEYLERSLCSHDHDLHSPLLRPYETKNYDHVRLP